MHIGNTLVYKSFLVIFFCVAQKFYLQQVSNLARIELFFFRKSGYIYSQTVTAIRTHYVFLFKLRSFYAYLHFQTQFGFVNKLEKIKSKTSYNGYNNGYNNYYDNIGGFVDNVVNCVVNNIENRIKNAIENNIKEQ